MAATRAEAHEYAGRLADTICQLIDGKCEGESKLVRQVVTERVIAHVGHWHSVLASSVVYHDFSCDLWADPPNMAYGKGDKQSLCMSCESSGEQ